MIYSSKNKIGVGVITFNRENMFRKCISSIPPVDELIVVNDGNDFETEYLPKNVKKYIHHKKNKGVAKSKNDVLKYLMEKNCDHLFLCEDDISIINTNVFEEYIKAKETSCIEHFNFAFHGPTNRTVQDHFKKILFENKVSISFHRFPIGAFTYYSRFAIEKVGLFDEGFRNFHDHVDHTAQLIKLKLHPPFGWFSDISDSENYIKDLDPDLSKSSANRESFRYKFGYYFYYLKYILKNGNPKVSSESELEKYLKQSPIKTKYQFVN